MKAYFSSGAMLLALQLLGCNVDVQQTEDGVTIAIECGESPTDEQPSDEEPGIDDPADDPGTDNPGTDEPVADDPGTDDPNTDDGTDTPLPNDG